MYLVELQLKLIYFCPLVSHQRFLWKFYERCGSGLSTLKNDLLAPPLNFVGFLQKFMWKSKIPLVKIDRKMYDSPHKFRNLWTIPKNYFTDFPINFPFKSPIFHSCLKLVIETFFMVTKKIVSMDGIFAGGLWCVHLRPWQIFNMFSIINFGLSMDNFLESPSWNRNLGT